MEKEITFNIYKFGKGDYRIYYKTISNVVFQDYKNLDEVFNFIKKSTIKEFTKGRKK